jgi:hypothetical protein
MTIHQLILRLLNPTQTFEGLIPHPSRAHLFRHIRARDSERIKRVIQQCKRHIVVSKLDVMLCDFNEHVSGAVMPVAEGGLVVHECTAVVVEAGCDVAECVEKAACDEGFAVVYAELCFAITEAFLEYIGC